MSFKRTEFFSNGVSLGMPSRIALGNAFTAHVTAAGLTLAANAAAIAVTSASVADAAWTATPSVLVKRDANGSFQANTITATLIGSATSAATANTAATATTATSAGSAAKLTTARSLSFTGDATASGTFDGSANVSFPVVLANTGVVSGSYGNASLIPVISVDAKGRITGLATAPVVSAPAGVTSVAGRTGPVTLSSADITDASSTATPSVLVKRDANGSFQANTITANTFVGALTGTAQYATTATSANTALTATSATSAISANTANSAGTATKLATGRAIAHSGDATGSGTFDGSADLTIPLVLANSGVTAGSFGSATSVPVLTIDAKGRVTAVASTAISFPAAPVTSVAGHTGAVVLASADITDATAANTASKLVLRDASGNFSAGTITATLSGNASTATRLAAPRSLSVTGDATGSATFDGSADAAVPVTLAATGVSAGAYTYASITVDAKGRVTSAANGASVQRLFYAEQLDDPAQSDWSVAVVAPAISDATYPSLAVRAFDDTAEEGVGFLLSIPAGVTTMTLRITGRAATAPSGSVGAVMRLHRRTIPIGAAPGAWAITALTTLAMPTNAFFQSFSQSLTLSSLGLSANSLAQFEITRQGSATADTLAGDLNVVQVVVEFS